MQSNKRKALSLPANNRSSSVFGNKVDEKDYEKACKSKASNAKRFGDDSNKIYHLQAVEAPVIGSRLGVRKFELGSTEPFVFPADEKPLVIGNIRMGFGHYRISMAMASAANALGFTPYWFDLCAFKGTTCTKLIEFQNQLYSAGSRLSQRVNIFNSLFWEPLNSEGFRQISYNASDQMNAELMVPVYRDLPKDIPFVATHVWPSQAAVHAGLSNVVNAIPDNWPMALHLSEGAIHTVQTPNAYLGYRMLRGMDGSRQLKPMPHEALRDVGHYIDHELVANVEKDCAERRRRADAKAPVRYLICVGGAGAQQEIIKGILERLALPVMNGEATVLLNVGDHRKVWNSLKRSVPMLKHAEKHFGTDFDDIEKVASSSNLKGIHVFCSSDIFQAVYSTNVLMRVSDVLVTKPSELSFYPVPKIMIKRVGGHEAWGAIRAAELGDGTYELQTKDEIGAMIDCIQDDRSIIKRMCDCIEKGKRIGVYDGAYKAVKLAAGIELD